MSKKLAGSVDNETTGSVKFSLIKNVLVTVLLGKSPSPNALARTTVVESIRKGSV